MCRFLVDTYHPQEYDTYFEKNKLRILGPSYKRSLSRSSNELRRKVSCGGQKNLPLHILLHLPFLVPHNVALALDILLFDVPSSPH